MIPGRLSNPNGIESEVSIDCGDALLPGPFLFRNAPRALSYSHMEAAVAAAVRGTATLRKQFKRKKSRPCCSTF